MGKQGKISAIKKEYNSSNLRTMQSELAQRGYTRVPGTGVFKFPYLEGNGLYRTGLDEKAAYISRIKDELEREIEVKRVIETKARIQEALGSDIDLGPRSKFWNYGLAKSPDDRNHVKPAKLMDGDNFFNLEDAWAELTFSWLRVHPTIASSYQAWERGEYPAEVQFFVSDESIENEVVYKKKQLINKAIIKFEGMSISRKRKVARMLGLPVTDDSKEELVYNLVDNVLKQTEFKNGKYQGLNPITIFNKFADMGEDLLTVRDLVKQAIANNIYRVKPSGKITEGDAEIAKDEDDLVKLLIDDDNQDSRIMLEQKLKGKKLMAV